MSCSSAERLHNLLETEMKGKMRNFIDHEVDLTSFAKYFFYDACSCRRKMHEIACGMDLSRELEYLSTLQVPISANMALAADKQRVMACGAAREILNSKWAIPSIEGNQQLSDELSCKIQEPCHVSNGSTKSEISMCERFFNSSTTEILDDQNAISFYLPFINEMCGELQCRLIDITKGFFANSQRKVMEERCRESWIHQNYYNMVLSHDREDDWQEKHDCARERFMTRAQLDPPQVLRMIDIEATCRQVQQDQLQRVVLIDYWDDRVQEAGYTAISHTYGMDVYKVFDCVCTTECYAKVHPRCSDRPCPHHEAHQNASSDVESEKRDRVVRDILGMCATLRAAGVTYAWHDGVCIAQHNESEVEETIKHIGWVYASANDTVIFLHYVGNPMAPIKHGVVLSELTSRWHTRVWTLQEAALSQCRRYCVRVGSTSFSDCQSLEEFEKKIALCYEDGFSKVEIVEEERFFEDVKEMERVLRFLCRNMAGNLAMPDDDDIVVQSNWMWIKALKWHECILQLLSTLLWTCFEFPTVDTALRMCSSRDSKHKGDRMNSILALAEVKDFVAPKAKDLEVSTIEFFKKQGQRGLAMALFSTNLQFHNEDKQYIREVRQHTWPPTLWREVSFFPVTDADFHNCIEFKVSEEGRMELRGELAFVEVLFTAKLEEVNLREENPTEDAFNAQSGAVLDFLEASQELAYLAIDLTFFDFKSRFRAKISGTPMPCRSMGNVFLSAFERCSSEGPVVYGQEIEEAESIHAHLVFPHYMLEPHTLSDSDIGVPLLLVQGRLHAPVYKIGLFKPTYLFIKCLQTIADRPAITTINNIVII